MLKNYIKIAWRNITKNKLHAAINVFGLSVGIAFTLLMAAYVWNELQVNKFLKNADNQYIIQSKWKDPNMGYDIATLGPLSKQLKEQYPTLVANYYRFDGITSNVSNGDKHAFINVDLGKIYRFMSFKIKPGNINTAIKALESKWNTLLPAAPFEYTFVDDTLKRLYQSEIQLEKSAQAATVIAVTIVVLGVVGLTSVSVQKRTREIGIRKVLGAASINIITLFLKEFLPVMLVGGIASIPIAYVIMRGWLNDYKYRVAITVEPFFISIFFLGLITSILIGLQIAKASIENPVKNLRTE